MHSPLASIPPCHYCGTVIAGMPRLKLSPDAGINPPCGNLERVFARQSRDGMLPFSMATRYKASIHIAQRGFMRIISGSARGRTLKTASGDGLRPAMARTRESLFSMLEAKGMVWQNAIVLDLFAGCGSLAFECLSRGAARAWLVDNGAPALACITKNAEMLDMADKCHLARMDARQFLRGTPPAVFNAVFIDPPYRRNLVNGCLARLAASPWLAQGAFVVAEVEKDNAVSAPGNLISVAERMFGQTCLHIWMNS